MLTEREVLSRQKAGVKLGQQTGQAAATLRIGVLSSFGIEMMAPFLRERFHHLGDSISLYFGPFGQITQEMLNPDSGLYRFQPDLVLAVVAAEDLLAPLLELTVSGGPEAEALLAARVDELRNGVNALLNARPGCTCYLAALSQGQIPAPNILDTVAPLRGQCAFQHFREQVRKLPAGFSRLVLIDWDWHTAGDGASQYHDDRLWYLARMRLNARGMAELSRLLARHVAAFRESAKKVIVADLDNTLWGGVVGEAGLAGITLGQDGVGRAFKDFQRALLAYRETGVLLALCSKNNPADAWEVFDRHPEMALKRNHFAAARINWTDKAQNIREMAEELNLGLDSFVFLDDNPVERDWVRSALPQVAVPELPADPAERPRFLRELELFDKIRLTGEDRLRAEAYAAQAQRAGLRAGSNSLEDFLASLEQVITIDPVDDATLGRAAQMCQRTNQFNLTTRRYTIADLERLRQNPQWELHAVAVRDRYGDNGIVGLAMLHFEGRQAEIDTLLLSCRVLGRKVEDALLSHLSQRAAARGVARLYGLYAPTAKNSQVADFYPSRGFQPAGEGRFAVDLVANFIPPAPGDPSEVSAHA
jgi:FkbH-like protein